VCKKQDPHLLKKNGQLFQYIGQLCIFILCNPPNTCPFLLLTMAILFLSAPSFGQQPPPHLLSTSLPSTGNLLPHPRGNRKKDQRHPQTMPPASRVPAPPSCSYGQPTPTGKRRRHGRPGKISSSKRSTTASTCWRRQVSVIKSTQHPPDHRRKTYFHPTAVIILQRKAPPP